MTNENRDRDERDRGEDGGRGNRPESSRGQYDTPGRTRSGSTENQRDWSGENAGRRGSERGGDFGETRWGGGESYRGGRGDVEGEWRGGQGRQGRDSWGFSQGGSYDGGYREGGRSPYGAQGSGYGQSGFRGGTQSGRDDAGYGGTGRGQGYDETRGQSAWGSSVDRPTYGASPYGQGQYGGTTWGGAPGGGTTYERGRHVGKGPKGYQRSDERIREDVCDRLTEQGDVDAGDVEVTVAAGEVTLVGTVKTRRDKREIEDVCHACTGVKDVHNQIKVKSENETSDESPALSAGPSSMGLPKSRKSKT